MNAALCDFSICGALEKHLLTYMWNKTLKQFQNYFNDIEHVVKYSQVAISLWNYFEIHVISGKFPRAEIKLLQTDVDEGWNSFEIILLHV